MHTSIISLHPPKRQINCVKAGISMSREPRAQSDTVQSAGGSQTIRTEVRATEEARHESDGSLW